MNWIRKALDFAAKLEESVSGYQGAHRLMDEKIEQAQNLIKSTRATLNLLEKDRINWKRERDVAVTALLLSEKDVDRLEEENARLIGLNAVVTAELDNYKVWPCEFSARGWGEHDQTGCTANLEKIMARNADDPTTPGDGHGIFVCGACYDRAMTDRNALKLRVSVLEKEIAAWEKGQT